MCQCPVSSYSEAISALFVTFVLCVLLLQLLNVSFISFHSTNTYQGLDVSDMNIAVCEVDVVPALETGSQV